MDDQHTADGPQESPADAAHRIRLMSAWIPPRSDAPAWVRQFGRPSGIEPGMRIVLVIEAPHVAEIALNGTPLPSPPPGTITWSHDVTAILCDRNELSLVPSGQHTAPLDAIGSIHGRADLPASYGPIALEILTPPIVRQ